jgi:hypothetical protein
MTGAEREIESKAELKTELTVEGRPSQDPVKRR